MEISGCSHPNYNKVIAIGFCTWHESQLLCCCGNDKNLFWWYASRDNDSQSFRSCNDRKRNTKISDKHIQNLNNVIHVKIITHTNFQRILKTWLEVNSTKPEPINNISSIICPYKSTFHTKVASKLWYFCSSKCFGRYHPANFDHKDLCELKSSRWSTQHFFYMLNSMKKLILSFKHQFAKISIYIKMS